MEKAYEEWFEEIADVKVEPAYEGSWGFLGGMGYTYAITYYTYFNQDGGEKGSST